MARYTQGRVAPGDEPARNTNHAGGECAPASDHTEHLERTRLPRRSDSEPSGCSQQLARQSDFLSGKENRMIEQDAERLMRGTRLHESVARQFSLPEGAGGRAVAEVMRVVNWLPNRKAISLLDVAASDDVLEVGFGPGHALKMLARLAPAGSVIGVDRSRTMFHEASLRNRSAIRAGRMSLRRGSFEALPLQDASVNRILAVNVMYFVGPLKAAFSEARRVLRPGGSISIYVTDRNSMEWLQFAGTDTRHAFDLAKLSRVIGDSAFGGDEIDIRRMWLPFGFRGLLVKITKAI
jgi:SAM-dependent methyltransferase